MIMISSKNQIIEYFKSGIKDTKNLKIIILAGVLFDNPNVIDVEGLKGFG